MENMQKVVRLGMGECGGRKFSTYSKIKITDGKLSITGVEGPLPSGNCQISCGQIYPERNEPDIIVDLAPGWTRAMLKKFWEVWRLWHLNDMRVGCVHQRKLGWKYDDHHDPKTFQGEACPECGYKIGSAWLKEELPQEVIDFLKSLPETDRQPAWV